MHQRIIVLQSHILHIIAVWNDMVRKQTLQVLMGFEPTLPMHQASTVLHDHKLHITAVWNDTVKIFIINSSDGV